MKLVAINNFQEIYELLDNEVGVDKNHKLFQSSGGNIREISFLKCMELTNYTMDELTKVIEFLQNPKVKGIKVPEPIVEPQILPKSEQVIK